MSPETFNFPCIKADVPSTSPDLICSNVSRDIDKVQSASLSSSETVLGLDFPSRNIHPAPSKSNLTVAPSPVSLPSIPF